MSQDTGLLRNHLVDKYYTNPDIARSCIEKILHLVPYSSEYTWIEPSAGAGAFVNAFQGPICAIDIEPDAPNIEKADFMTWEPPSGPRIFIGNPPFGRQASMARKFMARAAALDAAWIAFILPRSFEKPSLQSCIPRNYHLILSERLVDNAFTVNGQPHHVPCVYQIWEKRTTNRALDSAEEPQGFSYVKATERYDMVVRRVGVYAGRAYPTGGVFSPQSHYFLRLDIPSNVNILIQRICEHTFPTNTTGPRSLSKGEITSVLNRLLHSLHDEAIES